MARISHKLERPQSAKDWKGTEGKRKQNKVIFQFENLLGRRRKVTESSHRRKKG